MLTMRERPIIFNADMVRAVLDGRKTQTRRIIKWRGLNEGLNLQFSGLRASEEPGGWLIESNSRTSSEWRCQPTPCPFGAVGDRLWVRETFGFEIRSVGGSPHEQLVYRASKPDAVRLYECNGKPQPVKWTPSLHMRRKHSRITLEITGVRVERLQDISHSDAKSEGCWYGRGGGEPDFAVTPSDHFPTLWASIYGEESWQANPWVWVIEFKRVEVE
jgi:hypothetical protein